MVIYRQLIQTSGYNSQISSPSGASPTGTDVSISGGIAIPPYVNSTTQSPTNSPTWQLYYASQNITFNQIRQYTYTSGSNSWTYYIAIAPTQNSTGFAGATVTNIGAQSSTSYTSGGITSTNITSTTVQAGYYFLIGCVNGPYFKVFNSATENINFTSGGVTKLVMLNTCFWRNHGAADQTMNIPTQLGGSGIYNSPSNTRWEIGLGGIT